MRRRSRYRAGVRLLFSCAVVAMGGCVPRTATSIQFSPPPRVAAPAQLRPDPTILSAHLAFDDQPSFGGLDGIAMVFSEEIEAASLFPAAFLVLLGDGSRVLPTDAILAPASEADENRTVWLLGDFGDPRRRPPTDVVVIRPLHTESGASLQGALAPVSGAEEGGRIVWAESGLPPCASGEPSVRTYWTDSLRDVGVEDLASISLELVGGRTVHPSGFEDHGDPSAAVGEARDDNVLDLCVPQEERVLSVRVPAGLFADIPGHPNAATRAAVARRPAPE